MSLEQVCEDIKASLHRSALILRGPEKMQRHQRNVYHGEDLSTQAPMEKAPKQTGKFSGTFNTVRLKKYFGLGPKKKQGTLSQPPPQYYQTHPPPSKGPMAAYQEVLPRGYPGRYPEGWMYTTVTAKTVHTVYTAVSMRGAPHQYRQRPAIYAWDPYIGAPAMEPVVDTRNMCICDGKWPRGPQRVQCTCCSDTPVRPTLPSTAVGKRPTIAGRKLPGSRSSSASGKFSTISSGSGPKRKSILECEVSAYDLISKQVGQTIAKAPGKSQLDDSLAENFLEGDDDMSATWTDGGTLTNKKARELAELSATKNLRDLPSTAGKNLGEHLASTSSKDVRVLQTSLMEKKKNLQIDIPKSTSVTARSKSAIPSTRKAPAPPPRNEETAMLEDWDSYMDSKEMQIGGQRMFIANAASPVTNITKPPKTTGRTTPLTPPGLRNVQPNIRTSKPDEEKGNKWKPSGNIPRLPPNRKARPLSPPPPRPSGLPGSPLIIKVRGSPPPHQRSPMLLIRRETAHLSRDDVSVSFEEDVDGRESVLADDERSPMTSSRSRSTPNLLTAVRQVTNPETVFVVKPILKKPSSLDTSSETDSDLYASEGVSTTSVSSIADRRRKKHVHFKSRCPLLVSEPVVEEIPPLDLPDSSSTSSDEDDEDGRASSASTLTSGFGPSEDDGYLEPKKKPDGSEEPLYMNQASEDLSYDDCGSLQWTMINGRWVSHGSGNPGNKTNQGGSANQLTQRQVRRSQSERPRQRVPPNAHDSRQQPRQPRDDSERGPVHPPTLSTTDRSTTTMKGSDGPEERTLERPLSAEEHEAASRQLDWLIRERGSANLLPKSVRDSLRPEDNLYDDTGDTEDFGLPETGKVPLDGIEVNAEDEDDNGSSRQNGTDSSWNHLRDRETTRRSSVEFITNLRNRKFSIPRPPLMKSKSVPVRTVSLRTVSVGGGGGGFHGSPANSDEGVSIYEQIGGEPIYEELADYGFNPTATIPTSTLALLAPPPLPGDGGPTSPSSSEPRRSIFEGASRTEILSILQDAKERGVENMDVELQTSTNSVGEERVGGEELIDPQVVSSQRNHRIRISNISNLSDSSHSSEDSSNADDRKALKDRRGSVEVERNDSGVGPETSKPPRLRRQSSFDPDASEESQCEDCDQPVDAKTHTGNLFDPLVCKKCAKKRAERREIIAEIVETEIKYGRDLRIIQDEFSRPMAVAGLLTPDQLTSIFLNIDELVDANAKFTEKLRDAIDIAVEQGDDDYTTVNVGKLFLESTSMLHAFESYCVGQGSACLLLSSLEKEKELLRVFLRVSQMENTLLRRMNLNSFLMVPVQRVTKYPLLLDRLCKVTSYHHKDRDAIRDAQQKIELHLEHINQQAKDISGTKIWRRISHISGTYNAKRISANDQESGGNIKLRKMALEVLEWNSDEVRFVWEGKLQFTQIADHVWNRKNKTLKMTPVYALLVTLGKPNSNYRPDRAETDELMFPQNTGIREATLLLAKEKSNRQSLVRDPLFLQRCVICSDSEAEDMFEVQDFVNKEAFLFKAEDHRGTQEWLRQLRYHAKDLGSWRRRRNALANIMINGMFRQ